jgi:hypothetical protein
MSAGTCCAKSSPSVGHHLRSDSFLENKIKNGAGTLFGRNLAERTRVQTFSLSPVRVSNCVPSAMPR